MAITTEIMVGKICVMSQTHRRKPENNKLTMEWFNDCSDKYESLIISQDDAIKLIGLLNKHFKL